MLKPHGSETLRPLIVENESERADLLREAETLPSVVLSSAAAANAVMLGSGYFNPLGGFMSKADALSVCDRMYTTAGVFFPVPVLNLLADGAAIAGARRIALRDPNVPGHPVLAIQTVEAVEEFSVQELARMTRSIFRTDDPAHPGVTAFNATGRVAVSGSTQVLSFSYFATEFPQTFRTASQLREAMKRLGWKRVVAFQTRNPMHLAHEELCRMAKAATGADGVLIHMLLGKLKDGDVPAEVRDACIRTMVERYFPPNTVLIAGYGFDMLYAGPREAVLHALFRQNAGCSHFIVGRDHAGVGSYYGPFDAQKIFREEVPQGALAIEIFEADHTAWSKKLGKVVMMRDVPDHGKDDFVLLSGTKVRALLAAGQPLPAEFARPEVAEILMRHYQSEAAALS